MSPLLLMILGSTEAFAITDSMTTEQLCEAAGIVVIGKVTDVESAYVNGMITSEVTFDVERMIHGPNISTIGVYVYSGEVSGVRFALGSTPHFVEDDRYLLLLHPRVGLPPTIIGAGAGAIRLDASASLLSQPTLAAEWAEVCDD